MQLKGWSPRHTRPCPLRQQAQRPGRVGTGSPAARRARCVAQDAREQERAQGAPRPPQPRESSFPALEDEREDDGWLPKRQPGSFPSPGKRRRLGGLSSAWERFTARVDSLVTRAVAGRGVRERPAEAVLIEAGPIAQVDYLTDADAKFAPKSGGGEKAFDPLRDGPLRYLGYANECGCAPAP